MQRNTHQSVVLAKLHECLCCFSESRIHTNNPWMTETYFNTERFLNLILVVASTLFQILIFQVLHPLQPSSSQQPRLFQSLVNIWNQFFTEVPQPLVYIEDLYCAPQGSADMNDPAHLRRNRVTFPKVLQHFMNWGLLHHPVNMQRTKFKWRSLSAQICFQKIGRIYNSMKKDWSRWT